MLSAIGDLSGHNQAENGVRINMSNAVKREAEEKHDSWTSFEESESVEARGKEPPEKKITLFALRLALLEKAASVLGTLGFIWATVVLLGGFALTLERADFCFITTILVIESTRIFSRSHELEWQHETTLSVAEFRENAKQASCRFYRASYSFLQPILRPFSTFKGEENNNNNNRAPKRANCSDQHSVLRRWSSSNVRLVPYAGWLSVSKKVSKILFWSQLLSAMTCVALSVYRLAGQDFGVASGSDRRNRSSALNIFYGLSLAEAILFLLEKAYWQWKIIAGKLLVEVNQEYGFDPPELPAVRRFFYDAYSRCVNGSVFDGLKMDLVSFSVELLKSDSAHGQVTGARLLSSFLRDPRFEQETLRTIGALPDLVGRLVEILNWRNPHEQEIRRSAAEIISCLVREKRNSLRVARIPGALHSITSLLREPQLEIIQPYDYLGFSLLGLQILNSLAKHPGNCGKIGSNEKLLSRIIEFTEMKANFESEARIQNVKLSLHLLKMLASTKGAAGEVLRKEILEIVFTISNLRDVLLYRGFDHVQLQTLAAETLANLAMEDEGRESIGSTGGVMDVLFSLFFTHTDEETKELVPKAGEALTLLSLENKQNCRSMMKLKRSQCGECDNVITVLIAGLSDSSQGVHAARILRNICEYAETDHEQLREVSGAATKVVKLVLEEHGTFQEASIGLAAQIFKFLRKTDMDSAFEEAATTKSAFLMHLVEILGSHSRPSTSFPNIRRFCIELVISVLQKDKECFGMEKVVLKAAVESVMETTSEIERYSIVSGSIGLARHRIAIHSFIHTALTLLSA